jgi:hypothetical protein
MNVLKPVVANTIDHLELLNQSHATIIASIANNHGGAKYLYMETTITDEYAPPVVQFRVHHNDGRHSIIGIQHCSIQRATNEYNAITV